MDDIQPIARTLGLDTHNLSDSDSKALREVCDFVRDGVKEMNEVDTLAKVRSLEQKLGMTGLGERRIDRLYRHVKLQSMT